MFCPLCAAPIASPGKIPPQRNDPEKPAHCSGRLYQPCNGCGAGIVYEIDFTDESGYIHLLVAKGAIEMPNFVDRPGEQYSLGIGDKPGHWVTGYAAGKTWRDEEPML